MNPILGILLAAFDSFWVALVIIIGSAVYNWLQKRKESNGEQGSPPPGTTQPGASPTKTPRSAPRPSQPVSWEEELRRLLEGDSPVAPPPPPVIVVEKKPVAPAPASKPRAKPIIAQTPSAPDRPLVKLTDSSAAFERVQQLDKNVETQLGRVTAMAAAVDQKSSGLDVAVTERMSKVTGQHVAQAAVVQHKTDSPEIAQVVSLFRNPRSARQAILASFILGPPKALEN